MDSKTKKSSKNIITGFLNQIVTIAFGILIPRLVLVNLGSESNGLLNSINQLLVYVALLEAGIGGASLQALYGPCARHDQSSINAILAATKRYYKRTGTVYFCIIIVLTLLFPYTIQSEIPRSTIMAVMFLSGMPGAINYYFQGKLKILLQADGRTYVTTNLATIVFVLTSISKVILLIKGYGIVALQFMYLFFNICQMLVIVLYIKKHYPWLDLNVRPDFLAISKSKNVLIHQISSLVFNHTDIIVLTYFCGLKTVSVYSMYAIRLGMITTAISNFGGIGFVLGQSFNTDRERYLEYHDCYEVFNMTLTFSLFSVASIFILPFLKLYTANVTDITYIDPYLSYLFIAVQLISNCRASSTLVINYAQKYKETQLRAIFEALINIIVSLLAVRKFGIYGVLIGTIVSLLYRSNDMIIYANKNILLRSPRKTYIRIAINLVAFVMIQLLSRLLQPLIKLQTYPQIIIWAMITTIVVIPFFFLLAFISNRSQFIFMKNMFKTHFCKQKSSIL